MVGTARTWRGRRGGSGSGARRGDGAGAAGSPAEGSAGSRGLHLGRELPRALAPGTQPVDQPAAALVA